MKSIEMKTSGFIHMIYNLSYDNDKLPETTCAYNRRVIWSAVLAFLLLPLVLFRMFINGLFYLLDKWKYTRNNYYAATAGTMGYVFAASIYGFPTLIGGKAYLNEGEHIDSFLTGSIVWLVGLGIAILCVALIILLVIAIMHADRKINIDASNKKEALEAKIADEYEETLTEEERKGAWWSTEDFVNYKAEYKARKRGKIAYSYYKLIKRLKNEHCAKIQWVK